MVRTVNMLYHRILLMLQLLVMSMSVVNNNKDRNAFMAKTVSQMCVNCLNEACRGCKC